ncbi:amidohydrolase family protein [Streptomyces sp. HNM0574]|uniref:amidohydrolase family protein n=1 Tax=Streptomyces sp. HNM0574 TaxID=2714954 RepID=UPI00146AA79D|nr:amidohydrolase [Streptomyces sp. HNM0574]
MHTAFDIHAHAMPLPLLERLAARGLADLAALPEGVLRLDHRISGLADDRAPIPCPPEQYDTAARLARMDREQVGRQAVSLPPFLTCATAEDEALALDVVRAGNDALAEFTARAPDRLTALGTAPAGFEGAAREAARCLDELGTPGIACGTQGRRRELDHPVNEDLWALLAARRTFTFVHPSSAPGLDRMGDLWLPQLAGYPMETALAASRLVLGGLLDRHELTLCLAHGGGCLPSLRGRLTLGWERKPQARRSRVAPAERIDAFYYDTAVFSAPLLRELVDRVGADHVLLGTDTPFDLADTTPLATVRALGLGARATASILHGNAERALGAPAPAPAA